MIVILEEPLRFKGVCEHPSPTNITTIADTVFGRHYLCEGCGAEWFEVNATSETVRMA